MTCETCKFFVLTPDHGGGQCRRNSPTAKFTDGNKRNNVVWPQVSPEDWCGDFVAKEV
jgi:hypothetical protein